MSEDKPQFVPQLDAVLESLAEEVEAWAAGLGVELTYTDPVRDETGQHEWAAGLRQRVDWALRTAGTLLTARGKADLAGDVKRRVDELIAAAEGYEQRLDALADQCRIHIEGIVAKYRQTFGAEDPEGFGMMRLCKGIKRAWTLKIDDRPPETPEEFAEAIDRAWFEEDGAKRRAQAEIRRQAGELTEHLRLLAGTEACQSGMPSVGGPEQAVSPASAAAQDDSVDVDDLQFGAPQQDPYDARVVQWVGKRLYLGPEGSQIRELFMLLAARPGVPHSLGEVQRAVDGMETYRDEHGEEAFRKAMNRIAKALSKLRKHLRENDLDDHFVILKEGPADDPSYTMMARFGNS